MDTNPKPFDGLLSENKAFIDLPGTKLIELSNLDKEELELFHKTFMQMPDDQRFRIISRLVELAENDVELNFDGIFKLGLNDPDPEVRSHSIEGLWENEEISLITPLLKLLANDTSDKVRAIAAIALGRFVLLGEHGKLHVHHIDRIRDVLLTIIGNVHISEEVRRRALEAVSPLSIPVVKLAISTAYNNPNPRMKVSSLYAMGKNCDPDWITILMVELSNSDPEIRFEAATALGELGDESAVPKLICVGSDSDTEVRMAVVQALGKIGGTKAKDFLQNLLSSRDSAVQDMARQSLEELRINEDPLSL
jgi:HEAT repeat protein